MALFLYLPNLQGATDLEKQLELLVVENERLKQELKSCRSSELQKLEAAAETCSCSHCPYSQVRVQVYTLHSGKHTALTARSVQYTQVYTLFTARCVHRYTHSTQVYTHKGTSTTNRCTVLQLQPREALGVTQSQNLVLSRRVFKPCLLPAGCRVPAERGVSLGEPGPAEGAAAG